MIKQYTMKLFEKIVDLQNELFEVRKEGKKIGLVPTMGALHQGHASLVKRSVEDNDVTVVSVFLNPTQFNDKGDLERYPRNLDADCKLLEECHADYVFAPSVKEMYPTPDKRHFHFPPVTSVMEGAKRPGHFNGVCQVVSRLFYIVRPDRAYFGEKDFQQIAVIREMVRQLGFKLEIVPCPIVREADGLAKSSRNVRLTPENRAVAPCIYRLLSESLDFAQSHSVEETIAFVTGGINAHDAMEVEYYQIVDGITMQPITEWADTGYAVGCITVYCGDVRLIDNITYFRK